VLSNGAGPPPPANLGQDLLTLAAEHQVVPGLLAESGRPQVELQGRAFRARVIALRRRPFGPLLEKDGPPAP
jgi:hypothetical protein